MVKTKFEVLVVANIDDVETHIEIGYGENKLNTEDTAMILAQGIALLIKATPKTDVISKDYEVMERIIKYLNDEFISNESFKNIDINNT